MKERPILFSGPMVRAILEGRKTQTRRLVKFPSTGAFVCVQGYWTSQTADEWWPLVSIDGESTSDGDGNETPMLCPYGKPGDRLWVREAWKAAKGLDALSVGEIAAKALAAGYENPWAPMTYLADGRVVYGELMLADVGEFGEEFGRYRHPRFMPRWASRITVENEDIKVERLLYISAEDAIAEGLACVTKDGSLYKYGIPDRDGLPGNDDFGWPWSEWEADPRKAYFKLWDQIHGEGSHLANPWVWVPTFKVVQP